MDVCCALCGRCYNDTDRWTICPHGPLWAGPDDYCPKHDLVNCSICKYEKEKMEERNDRK